MDVLEKLRTETIPHVERDGTVIKRKHFLFMEAADEIERLRKELAQEVEEHNRCTTFHATAAKEVERLRQLVDDPYSLHRREIERLRGLLIELLEGDGTTTEYLERVREALGDGDD